MLTAFLYPRLMPLDLFAGNRPDSALHPQFLKTRDDPKMAPARAMLNEIAATMHDPDGNLIEQFQTHGFDARTFEIYLQALFTEAGHTIDRSHKRPDYLITRQGLTVAVEAVTANPTPKKDYQPYDPYPTLGPKTKEEAMQHLKHEVAIKLGSPLFTKLKKRYWDMPQVAGRPFVIAIETFHGGTLSLSSTALSQYLFGIDHSYRFNEDGSLIVEGTTIEKHIGSKEIPSNFFAQPEAENISAILFSNAGTVPKFARIGHQGAHRSDAVRMVRYGNCLDPDPNAINPEHFAFEIGDPDVPPEPWRDGAVLIHNPNALYPIPEGWMGVGSEENLAPSGTVISSYNDPFQPFASMTAMFDGSTSDDAMWAGIELQMTMLQMGQAVADAWRQ